MRSGSRKRIDIACLGSDITSRKRAEDEVAARVLRTGGTVKAVRSADLPDGALIAATFRSPA